MKQTSNAATRRSHKIIEILATRYFDGLSNKELARAVGTSEVNICRDLKTLADIGYLKRAENGNWVLSPKPISIFFSYYNHYEKLKARMEETHRNILAGASS